jgi:hypothetical protein
MSAYDAYLNNQLSDYELSEDILKKGLESVPKVE